MTTRTKLKLIGALILAILAVVLVVRNTDPATVMLIFYPIKMSIAALIFFSILIGFALGLLVAFLIARRQKQPPA